MPGPDWKSMIQWILCLVKSTSFHSSEPTWKCFLEVCLGQHCSISVPPFWKDHSQKNYDFCHGFACWWPSFNGIQHAFNCCISLWFYTRFKWDVICAMPLCGSRSVPIVSWCNHRIVRVLWIWIVLPSRLHQQDFNTLRIRSVLSLLHLFTLCTLTRAAHEFSHNSGSNRFSPWENKPWSNNQDNLSSEAESVYYWPNNHNDVCSEMGGSCWPPVAFLLISGHLIKYFCEKMSNTIRCPLKACSWCNMAHTNRCLWRFDADGNPKIAQILVLLPLLVPICCRSGISSNNINCPCSVVAVSPSGVLLRKNVEHDKVPSRLAHDENGTHNIVVSEDLIWSLIAFFLVSWIHR